MQNSIVKQNRILGDDAHIFSQRLFLNGRDVSMIKKNFSRLNVVESKDQSANGGFSSTCCSNNGRRGLLRQ